MKIILLTLAVLSISCARIPHKDESDFKSLNEFDQKLVKDCVEDPQPFPSCKTEKPAKFNLMAKDRKLLKWQRECRNFCIHHVRFMRVMNDRTE